ncbi:MAG: hypothetical protein PHD31_03190 [Candidatus Pacebacteria bacterium]|nr:hypothetical protein [Candidatus Paceibacterota bacterium]
MIIKVKVLDDNGTRYGENLDGVRYRIVSGGDTKIMDEIRPGDDVLINCALSNAEESENSREYFGRLVTEDFDGLCLERLFGNALPPKIPSSPYMALVFRKSNLLVCDERIPNNNDCLRGDKIHVGNDSKWKKILQERISQEGNFLDGYRKATLLKERGDYVVEHLRQLFGISGTNDASYEWNGEKVLMPMKVGGCRWIWFKKGQPVIIEHSQTDKGYRKIVANFNHGNEMRLRQLLFDPENDHERRLTRYDYVLFGQIENSWRRGSSV